MNPKDASFVLRVTVLMLALVFVTIVGTMILGLFKPEADHEKIVAILEPTFHEISGIFIGIATTLVLGRALGGHPPAPPAEPLQGPGVDNDH